MDRHPAPAASTSSPLRLAHPQRGSDGLGTHRGNRMRSFGVYNDMKKTIALVAILVLGLTGCAQDAGSSGDKPPPAPASTDAPASTPTERERLAAIVVTRPEAGDRVTSPVRVSGTADVFEATVQMRLLDADGNRLARAFTTATCGNGCRGKFSRRLRFNVGGERQGVLEVWWTSPEDGTRQDVVRVPVTLVP